MSQCHMASQRDKFMSITHISPLHLLLRSQPTHSREFTDVWTVTLLWRNSVTTTYCGGHLNIVIVHISDIRANTTVHILMGILLVLDHVYANLQVYDVKSL